MDGMLIVNNLAGLLIVTSMLVIGTQSVLSAARWYALQSLVLVGVFLALAATQGSGELYLWSLSAFVTKVVLVPLIMVRTLGRLADREQLPGVLGTGWMMLLAALIVMLSWFAVSSVKLAVVADLKPALAVSLGHFMLGLMCIVTQRNILKQIFGYCLMENGAHLTLALMASKAPELVEVGIATDAVFAVLIMAILARRIQRTLNTLDVKQLTALKG
ncbi:MAG: hydrogenase 4 membrane subunit [Paludibacterium sp.]|uniref:hydrogenase 4 membrane subunit n=1 Tax=Paludibacterium sp. TaxID=1917523 RepID=UPI0025EAB4D0|nr:hydrogenase 4 membrane subunit [Paludibacterium sp.]MBV8047100.1 hydrogenase 4 membrane subunit [Paludibacterium sp.]MBV8648815.1 hydrogenase 4 membrane subunit [Paludibacterium sp.]